MLTSLSTKITLSDSIRSGKALEKKDNFHQCSENSAHSGLEVADGEED
jgi:hypothetical protein